MRWRDGSMQCGRRTSRTVDLTGQAVPPDQSTPVLTAAEAICDPIATREGAMLVPLECGHLNWARLGRFSSRISAAPW